MPLNDSYEVIYERAHRLAASRRWEQAVEEYERIFNRLGKLSPETRARHGHLEELFARTCYELLFLLQRLEADDRIIATLERLMDTAPDKQLAWRSELAQCRIRKGEVEQGLAELQALANEEPDEPFLELSLGHFYFDKEAHGEAISHFSRAIELADETDMAESKSAGYQGLFHVYAATGQLDMAAESWKSAAALDDSMENAVSQLYDVYLSNGDTQGARALIIQDKNPLRRGLYAGMADYLDGDTEAAELQWKKVLRREINEESESVESWMEAGLRLGDTKRVIEGAFPLMLDGKVSPRLTVLCSIAVAMQGNTAHADAFLTAARLNFVWKRNGKLSTEYWGLMDDFVVDQEVKSSLRHHFEGSEETEAEGPAAEVAEESVFLEALQGAQTEDEE